MPDSGTARVAPHGEGFAIAQCGEVFQGVLREPDGELHRCLVSLPCNELFSQAHLELSPLYEGVVVEPSTKRKALNAAKMTLERLGIATPRGVLRIASTIPEGKGYGSSTADCIAAVLAVASSAAKVLVPGVVCLC